MSVENHGLPGAGAKRLTRLWPATAVLVAVAVAAALSLPWVVAAICLCVLVLDRTHAGRAPVASDLDLALERCRRRGEETTFVVIDIPSTSSPVADLLQTVRMTDSLVVRRSACGCEVHGLLEGGNSVRTQVEKRFADALDGITPTFGWASYPADGLTVDGLYGKAREAIVTAPRSERAPAVRWRRSTRCSAIEHTLEASPKGA